MVTVGHKKESFSQGDQTVYTATMQISKKSHEEITKTTKLELFLILFPIDYLKEVLIPEMNNFLKYPMDPGEFTR